SGTDPLGAEIPEEKKKEIREYLEKHSDRVSGLIPIDPSQPVESCRKMEDWIKNGPCIGIKYYGGNPGGVVCSHANNDAIIRLAALPPEGLQAVIPAAIMERGNSCHTNPIALASCERTAVVPLEYP